ncbi:MAG: bestrophin family ion channel, partial [Candidatus Kapaibacterium sp.]
SWSKKPMIYGFFYSLLISIIFYTFEIGLGLPWQPIGVIGIAVAFYLGFKNNSSYDRTWEARKIWGGIVNNSRSIGTQICSFVKGYDSDHIKKELIYRHIAWLTALRYQLRLSRTWEHKEERIQNRYSENVCENYTASLNSELSKYISQSEIKELEGKSNLATQILKTQSVRFQELRDNETYEDFRHMELQNLITNLYEEQGKAERIKNFPFPRQYASTALWLTFVFCALVPLGLVDIFNYTLGWVFWLSPIMSALIIWIFFLMEKIGDYSENPFEGTYNDVPITSIARGIEIDMREMINDTDIPKPTEPEFGFLM